MEIKDGSKTPSQQRLTSDQQVWHQAWAGKPVQVVKSVDEALKAIGL